MVTQTRPTMVHLRDEQKNWEKEGSADPRRCVCYLCQLVKSAEQFIEQLHQWPGRTLGSEHRETNNVRKQYTKTNIKIAGWSGIYYGILTGRESDLPNT